MLSGAPLDIAVQHSTRSLSWWPCKLLSPLPPSNLFPSASFGVFYSQNGVNTRAVAQVFYPAVTPTEARGHLSLTTGLRQGWNTTGWLQLGMWQSGGYSGSRSWGPLESPGRGHQDGDRAWWAPPEGTEAPSERAFPPPLRFCTRAVTDLRQFSGIYSSAKWSFPC